ncbi:MAG: serine protease [Phycisphaerae bacterium]|nr:MAG: serine protease [Phycisphaerae bacterium]
MNSAFVCCLTAALACTSASAQPSPAPVHPAISARFAAGADRLPVWVFLADKGVAPAALPAALANAQAAMNPRTLQRRLARRTDPGLVDERDLPVHSPYRDAIAATGATIRQASRWANAISVLVTPDQAAAIAALPCVARLEPVRTGPRTQPIDFTPTPAGGYANRDFYGPASPQLAQINLQALHTQGFTGAGVIIGILDTGFHRAHDSFNTPGHAVTVIAEHDFINNDNNAGIDPGDPGGQHSHGTLILGCIGAYQPNVLVGGAYNASFILCKTEDITSETPIEEDNYVAGLEFIEAHGGDVATSSLGYIDWYTQADLDGLTAVTTLAVNVATANGLHCCTAAGNEGHDDNPATSSLIAPADALRVITCGAGRIDGSTSSFTSSGPTADGRVKPEVLARGSGTYTVHPDDLGALVQASGTSLSTPLVAAAVACIVQAHPTWTVDQLRAALFATASDMVANGQPDPLYIRGYGFVNAADAAAFQPPSCDPDVNCDGAANGVDVEVMELAVGGDLADFCQPDADFNADGAVNGTDVEAVELVVGGQACP